MLAIFEPHSFENRHQQHRHNDQGAFDAANNHFVAPVDGTDLFGATLLYEINASATARMHGRLA